MSLSLAALPQEPGSYVSATTLAAPYPSATIPLTKGLFIPTDGAVVVTMADGVVVTFANVAAGTTLPIRVTRVETGTIAAIVLALY